MITYIESIPQLVGYIKMLSRNKYIVGYINNSGEVYTR